MFLIAKKIKNIVEEFNEKYGKCREPLYKTLHEWRKANLAAYHWVYRQGRLEELCLELGWELPRKNKSYKIIKYNDFTFNKCKEEAKKHKTVSGWRSASPETYKFAKEHSWYNKCIKHIKTSKLENKIWCKDSCIKEAKNFSSRKVFIKNSGGCAKAAKRLGIYEECCEHMFDRTTKFTFEECKEIALLFKHKKDWIKNNIKSYNYARKHGWLEECAKHMIPLWERKWYTLEICKENALKYSTRGDWIKNDVNFYNYARKHGWLEECTKHMMYNYKRLMVPNQ